MPDYRFSTDWFTAHVPVWERHLAPLVGREGLRYLEVGVFEGRSLLWTLDHLLTADSAHATAIDTFAGAYEAVFRDNLARAPRASQVTVLKGESASVLRSLPLATYQLVYLDGGHGPHTLLVDLALVWDLLEVGGVLVIDDYRWRRRELPVELRPGPVVDCFLRAFASEIEILSRGYQVLLRRVAPRHALASAHVPAHARAFSTQLGDWFYLWNSRRIIRADGGDEIVLHPAEQAALRLFLRSTRARWARGLVGRALAWRSARTPTGPRAPA